jgi:hypothetical protein
MPPAADVEGADEIEVNTRAERVQAVRDRLADGALADSPTCRGDRDVQSTEVVDGLPQHLLGTSDVGDVEFVEGPTDGVCDFLALRLRPIQHRYAGAALGQRSAVARPQPEAPPTMTAFLPSISIQLPFKTVTIRVQPVSRTLL